MPVASSYMVCMYRIQPSGIPECSTRTCFHRQPPHLTARGGGGGVLIHTATSRPSIVHLYRIQHSTEPIPGHATPRLPRSRGAGDPTFLCQVRILLLGPRDISVCGLRRRRRVRRGHGVEHFALLGCVVPRRRRARSEMSWSHEPICSVGLGSLWVKTAQCENIHIGMPAEI